MPAEVYTISGAPGGYMPPASDKPSAMAATGPRIAPAILLQNALKALGATAGDPQLSRVVVDGVIGANTVKAVNYALATYVGGTPGFPSANLTADKVRQNAGALAVLVGQRVQKSGGTIPPPQVHAIVHRSSAGGAGGGGSMIPSPSEEAPNRTWVWYVVGGVGILIVLSMAVSAVKKRKA